MELGPSSLCLEIIDVIPNSVSLIIILLRNELLDNRDLVNQDNCGTIDATGNNTSLSNYSFKKLNNCDLVNLSDVRR